MEKDENNYSGSFLGVEFNSNLDHHPHDHHHGHDHHDHGHGHQEGEEGEQEQFMADYLLSNPPPHHGGGVAALDRLSFADVMQFADLGPKLALNHGGKTSHEEEAAAASGLDPVYFLKFPVLNDRLTQGDVPLMAPRDEENGGVREEGTAAVQRRFLEEMEAQKGVGMVGEGKKRKRPRTTKTSEEVESQRMTHIAVERNRRKQMNEHLRVLRSLMPGSYVQRGDQASIIGGAIEFVRELEQLLQCLESQKRRRIYGDAPRAVADAPSLPIPPPQNAPFLPPLPLPSDDPIKLVEYDTGLREETAESKSCLADIEVRLLGFDAMIKILCRRRPGQLIKTIAALEDLQLSILHTNITTIEQTVLYSFNVKVASETRFSADDIANSVQQIISFIHTNT